VDAAEGHELTLGRSRYAGWVMSSRKVCGISAVGEELEDRGRVARLVAFLDGLADAHADLDEARLNTVGVCWAGGSFPRGMRCRRTKVGKCEEVGNLSLARIGGCAVELALGSWPGHGSR